MCVRVHTHVFLCKSSCVCLIAQSCLTLYDPMDCSLQGSSVHGYSPGKNTGVGCHALLQGIFPTQRWNPGLSHCRQILYFLSHQGSPRILEWIVYPFSKGASWPRYQTEVSFITGRFFTSWAIREAQQAPLSMTVALFLIGSAHFWILTLCMGLFFFQLPASNYPCKNCLWYLSAFWLSHYAWYPDSIILAPTHLTINWDKNSVL